MLKTLSIVVISFISFSTYAGTEVGNGFEAKLGTEVGNGFEAKLGTEVGNGLSSEDGTEIGNGIVQLSTSSYDYLNCNDVAHVRNKKILALIKSTISSTVKVDFNLISSARPLSDYVDGAYHKRIIRAALVKHLQSEFGEATNVELLVTRDSDLEWAQADFLVRDIYTLVLTSFEQNCSNQ